MPSVVAMATKEGWGFQQPAVTFHSRNVGNRGTPQVEMAKKLFPKLGEHQIDCSLCCVCGLFEQKSGNLADKYLKPSKEERKADIMGC